MPSQPETNTLVLAKSQAILKRVDTQNAITHKIAALGHNLMRQRVKEFLIKYADKRGFTAKILSKYYPLSNYLLEKFEDKWDWGRLAWEEAQWNSGRLASNKSLHWSVELIEKHEDKWNWDFLSQNKSLPWSVELIEKFEDKWSWWALSYDESLHWPIEFFEKYEDKWIWYFLSKNESLSLSIDLIEKFKDKWNWKFGCTNLCIFRRHF